MGKLGNAHLVISLSKKERRYYAFRFHGQIATFISTAIAPRTAR